MQEETQTQTQTIEQLFRDERRSILATLIRLIGDFDRAEDALAAAWEAALVQWPREGRPVNPRAWLIRAARNKAVDDIRRRMVAERGREELEQEAAVHDSAAVAAPDEAEESPAILLDDQLRLIFTCCHPALAVEAQVALTLRTLAGLSTEEIARAFLLPAPTMAQRLVRAKHKIREAGIPYRIPDEADRQERTDAVLTVIYLVFNEGYAATSGQALVRHDLAAEAIRLGRLLCDLLPEQPAPRGLLALMLLHDSRRDARADAAGDLVLLEDQDRARWDQNEIREGLLLVDLVLRQGAPDSYALQAAIAAVHAQAARAADTDWRQIAALYARLYELHPSPVVMLNHAVAVAMADGPAAGLAILDRLAASGVLAGYHLLPAARADLLRRQGRAADAAAAYREALALVSHPAERRFLQRRLAEVDPTAAPLSPV
ncbi:MAG: polymerase sigma-70 factor, subfamily [Myxococcales bacterium]|jgi:RNA polymerase sigma-70 factor (ECF subfamily)|nr:polymerase sigma-70 factor, subfamily [Myxococcales bacterium]